MQSIYLQPIFAIMNPPNDQNNLLRPWLHGACLSNDALSLVFVQSKQTRTAHCLRGSFNGPEPDLRTELRPVILPLDLTSGCLQLGGGPPLAKAGAQRGDAWQLPVDMQNRSWLASIRQQNRSWFNLPTPQLAPDRTHTFCGQQIIPAQDMREAGVPPLRFVQVPFLVARLEANAWVAQSVQDFLAANCPLLANPSDSERVNYARPTWKQREC